MSTQVEIPAGSAPATEVEIPEVSVQERLDHATSAELDTWRKTGDIPAVKVKNEAPPKPAESAPAKEVTEEKKAKPEVTPASNGEKAAATPPAPTQKPESRSEKRWRELSEQFGDLKRENEELKRKFASQPSASEKPESRPAAEEKKATEVKLEAEPELGGINAKTGKPYQTLAEWQKDHTEWLRKQILSEVEGSRTKAEQARTQSEQERALAEGFTQKSQAAAKKYSDFEAVALDGKLPIPKGSPADLFILDADDPGEILYYLGKHPEVLAEFYGCKYDSATKTWDYGDFDFKTGKFTNHVNPIRQIKRLEAIEREVTAKPVEKKAEVPANIPPPKLPPPPTEVSGRRAAPVDEAEAALARGDTAAYMRAMNARDEKASRR